MEMTKRTWFSFVIAVCLTACVASEPTEPEGTGQSRLDRGADPGAKKPGGGAGTKPVDDDRHEPKGCTWWGDGSNSSCKSADLWKQYASAGCTEKGGALNDITFGDVCADGRFRFMKYQCCTATEEGPKDPGKDPPKEPAPSDEGDCEKK